MNPDDIGAPVTDHGQTGILRAVIKVAAIVERFSHEHGWGILPPVVYEIGRHDDGSIEPAPMVLGIKNDPQIELAGIAQMAETMPLPPREGGWPWPVAHILVMESIALELLPDGCGGRLLADIPSAREIRQATGVVGKRTFQVTRFRGHEPRVTVEGDSEVGYLTGGMTESLRRLHRAVRMRHRNQKAP